MTSFISTWNTTNTGASASNQIKLPLVSSGTYNFSVDWGDGTSNTITAWNQAQTTHTYASSGIKTVTITGIIEGWAFGHPSNLASTAQDKAKITNISDWGPLNLSNVTHVFQGCVNLTITAPDNTLLHMTFITSLTYAFHGCTSLTSFPLIDTSNVTNLDNTWSDCTGLTSFPLLDTSSVTDFNETWKGCTDLTSFPLIDVSNATDFYATWRECSGLTTFPLLDTSSGINFNEAWNQCVGLTSFPLIDTSNGTTFQATWGLCINLTSFPLINTSSAVDLTATWGFCSNLTSFPLIDTSSAIVINTTWVNCSDLTSFPLIDTSSGNNFTSAWAYCSGLTSFPLIDASNGTVFSSTWSNCTGLTSFPLIDVSSGINFELAWTNCTGLTSFPLLNVSSGTNFNQSWDDCLNLTSFPVGFGLNLGLLNIATDILVNTPLTIVAYSRLLQEIESVNSNSGVTFNASSNYNLIGEVARTALITDHSWTITDGSLMLNSYNEVGSGGIKTAGNVINTAIFNRRTSGGIKTAGFAKNSSVFNYTSVAELFCSGYAEIQTNIPTFGGALIGGSSIVKLTSEAKGGVLVGGSALQTFIDYIDGSGGINVGGSSNSDSASIKKYTATGSVFLQGGSAYGTKGGSFESSGQITIGGSADINFRFIFDLELLWNTRSYIVKDTTFYWNVGQLPIYWYRIIGKGRNGNECPLVADPCCQKFIINIHARTLAELCGKLKARRFFLPIESVQRFSRPAETNVLRNLQSLGQNFDCDVLEPVEVCDIPQCADYCIDYDLIMDLGFDITNVQVDAFSEYEATGEIYIGGSATTNYNRFDPEYSYTSTGSLVITGDTSYISSGYAYTSTGSLSVSGSIDALKSSSWSYVGGKWADVISNRFSISQESLIESPGDIVWNLVERIKTNDNLNSSTDLSYVKKSQFLIARNFNLNIPVDKRIVKVIVDVERWATQSGVRDLEIYLVVGDEIISDNLADTVNDWPVGVSFSSKQYGDTIPWSDDIDVNDLNNNQFGVAFRVQSLLSLPAIIANVDYISMNVYYEDEINQLIRISGTSPASYDDFHLSFIGREIDYEPVSVAQYKYISNGSIKLGGAAEREINTSLIISDILSAQSVSDYGTFVEVSSVDISITDLKFIFSKEDDVPESPLLSSNISACGCTTVPLIVNLEHNFVRDNVLSKFISRNNLTFPTRLKMSYNRSNDSWQANLHYVGFSTDANTKESWNVIFELQCTDFSGLSFIGRNIWKLSIQIFRKNLTTFEDYDTRIIVSILPETICNFSTNELRYKIKYDTQIDMARVDPNSTIYQSFIYDNIGLFRNQSWIKNPELILSISQIALEVNQNRLNLTQQVIL